MTEKKENDTISINKRLRKWEEAGIRLYLDGAPTSSEDIEKNCVNEETLYMPDFVTDENGNLKEIRYDKISLN